MSPRCILLFFTLFASIVALANKDQMITISDNDDYFKSVAKPFIKKCEARAEAAGVSRPNEEILVNNCLHDYIIRTARTIVKEVDSVPESSRDQARADADMRDVQSYLKAALGIKSNFKVELGRYLDRLKNVRNNTGLVDDED